MPTSEELRTYIKPEVVKLRAHVVGQTIEQIFGARVVIAPVIPFTDADRVESQGILAIPEHVKKANTPRPSTGIVIAIGPECREDIREGDYVVFSSYAGYDIVIDRVQYKILDDKEIMLKLSKPDPDQINEFEEK